MPHIQTNESRLRRGYEEVQANKRERESRENRGFTQVYERGWNRLDTLIQNAPQAARLYMFIAKHMDGAGALVAAQSVLAQMLGVSEKTIQRHSKALEDQKALVRIRLQGGIIAYCLNPEEVWKAYDSNKQYAAFWTKTLVKTSGASADKIRRRLTVMLHEQRGEPELPLDAEDAEEMTE